VPRDRLVLKVTDPAGLVAPVALVSVTVAEHVEIWFTTTGVSQETEIIVGFRVVKMITFELAEPVAYTRPA
jgi:hypothetical protein